MTRKRRTITDRRDEKGKKIVLVPLSDKANGRHTAIVYEKDWDELIALGLSPRWRFKIDGKFRRVTVWNTGAHREVEVARLIVAAGPGQGIVYVNNNPLDLRTGNLGLGTGRGKYKDRDLIQPNKLFQSSDLVRHEFI
jgi:hypothetical protein